MSSEELQTLLDINSSNNFQELRSRTASRLSAMQEQFSREGYYDGTYKNNLGQLIRNLEK